MIGRLGLSITKRQSAILMTLSLLIGGIVGLVTCVDMLEIIPVGDDHGIPYLIGFFVSGAIIIDAALFSILFLWDEIVDAPAPLFPRLRKVLSFSAPILFFVGWMAVVFSVILLDGSHPDKTLTHDIFWVAYVGLTLVYLFIVGKALRAEWSERH